MTSAPTFSIEALSTSPRAFASRIALVGDGAAVMNQALASMQGGDQPELPAGTHVTAPGLYKGINGQSYVVPTARLAMRQNLPGVPDVFFDQKDGGGWLLQAAFELVLPAGSPDATLMPLSDFQIAIDPGTGDSPFVFPAVSHMPADGRPPEVAMILRAEAPIDAGRGLILLRQNAKATFKVSAIVHFCVPVMRPVPHPIPPFPVPPRPIPFPQGPGPRPMVLATPQVGRPVQAAAFRTFRATDLLLRTPDVIIPRPLDAQQGSAPVDATVPLSVDPTQNGACFPSDLPVNRPIYALILGGIGGSDAVWTRETGASWTRIAAGLNRYDVLPDSFALAIDPNTGLPAMSVVLVQNPPASPGGPSVYAVRVRFGVAPQLDDARLDAVRASLRSTHAIPYASLGIGDYGTATFTPSGLFADLPGFQSATGGGDPATGGSRPVDAASGFELVLDCSLEFYTLLTGVLKSPEGLRGSVRFQIVTGRTSAVPSTDITTLVDVPVRLAFSGDMEVDLVATVAAPSAAGAASLPLRITNPLDVPVSIGAVLPTFLLMDKRPDLASLATPGTATPATVTVPPKTAADIAVTGPAGGALPPYTALATGFSGVRPAFDPEAVLNRVHALASATGASTAVHLSCYLLHHPDQIPPALAGLIGLKVQVQRPNGPVLDVPLTLDKPEADLTLPYSFADLLGGASLDQPSVTYRSCIMFPDHLGPWSEWLSNIGRDLTITPMAG